jgi:alpha-tubulin suppressor-like RCC1 family protein
MTKSAFYGPAFLALALAALVSACGGDSTAPNRPAEVVVTIVPPTDTLRSLGATAQFTTVVKDAGGSVIAAPVVNWTSTNAAVVTFDASGLATAVSNGSAYVQARSNGVVDSVALAVHQRIDPTKSTISVVRPLLFVDDTVRITFQARDALNHPLAFGGAAIVFSPQGGSSAGTFRPVVDNQNGTYSADFVGVSLGTPLTIAASIDGGAATSSLPTVRVVGFTRIAAAGGSQQGAVLTTGGYTCGIITTGDMYCWGISWFGVRGNGSFGTLSPGPTPTLVGGGHQWTDVATGMYYVCAVASGGSVFCWGSGSSGELGNGIFGHGSLDNVANPTPISGTGTFGSVSIGSSNGACTITLTKSAMCWGVGVLGRLGNGSDTLTAVPVAVSGGLSFDALHTTFSGTCGIAAGSAYCWGAVQLLGIGGSSPDICGGPSNCAKTPVAVSGGHVFRPIVAIDGNVVCAAATDDQTYCWGSGYLGNGSSLSYAVAPTVVSGGLSFTSLTAGDAFHCGTVVGGAAYCWGGNRNGRLGNGTITEALVPTAVSGGHAFTQLSSSQDHTCGVATDGNAYCWGGNDMGELGTRTTTPSMTPVRVKLFAP